MLKRIVEQVGDRIIKLAISAPDDGCYYVAKVEDFKIVGIEACYRFWTKGSRYAALRAARAWLRSR